jgi:hypothetical protein
MEAIRKWFNSAKNYTEGVALYKAHGRDEKLKRVFAIEGESEFKRKKLQEELMKLLSKAPPASNLKPQTSNPKPQTAPAILHAWPEEKDDIIMALWLEWKPLYSEMNSLQARLYDVAKQGLNDAAKKNEAGEMAHRILDLSDGCDTIYEKRDHYLQHKKLPEAEKSFVVVVDPLKMPLALSTAKRMMREYKLQLKKDPANLRAAQNLKRWEEREEYYSTKLKLNG